MSSRATRWIPEDKTAWLFFAIVVSYCWIYAPFGINETDGGFITALAWRVLNGELPYQDFIYVRPPASIYLRALEMTVLPDSWEVIGGRILFYLKIGLYTFLAAAVLSQEKINWNIATIGFILSVHNYPAAPWHTVDGLLFASLASYFLFKYPKALFLVALFTVVAMLCKQSFYPLLFIVSCAAFWVHGKKMALRLLIYLASLLALLFFIFQWMGIWPGFLFWTQGATQITDLIQFSILDYFRLNPKVLAISLLLIPAFLSRKIIIPQKYYWYSFLFGLMVLYVYDIVQARDFVLPGDQIRLLFLLAIAWQIRMLYMMWSSGEPIGKWGKHGRDWIKLTTLLSVSWMASVSWGYNLPILFSLPIVYALFEISKEVEWGTRKELHHYFSWALIACLLVVFRLANTFVYRDGPRIEMNYPLAKVSPKLTGIYSNKATYKKYLELNQFVQEHNACYVVLPSFPQAHYLTNTQSSLPLDWVIQVEYNRQTESLQAAMDALDDCIVLIEKEYLDKMSNPKFEISNYALNNWQKVKELDYFFVLKK